MVPSRAAGKSYIKKVLRLINYWIENSILKSIALKLINIMSALLLKKPSKRSNTKDHISGFGRRLILWEEGKFGDLFWEAKTIQNGLKTIFNSYGTASISKQFADLMQKWNVTSFTEDSILEGPIIRFDLTVYAVIDSSLILRAAVSIKVISGPSSKDTDGWRKIVFRYFKNTSKHCGDYGEGLKKYLAALTQKLFDSITSDKSLETFLACQLIPLGKCFGVRSTRLGKVLEEL